jgi:YD repeat-containing protein
VRDFACATGQLAKTDALDAHALTGGYDTRGDLISISDPLSHQINIGYDFQGQLTSITDPLNDTAQFGLWLLKT